MNAVKIIPNDIFFAEVKDILDGGESVTINVTGHSMMPTFKDGKDKITVSPCDAGSLKAGDVVLFDRGDTICVHRIIRRDGNRLVIRGDGNRVKDKEYVTVKAVMGVVTGGTMKGGRTFTVEDEMWKRNTAKVMRWFPLMAAVRRITGIMRRYPLSIIALSVLLYLSFFNPEGKDLPSFIGADKVVHVLMYFLLSSVFWFEWHLSHRRRHGTGRGLLFCVVLPVLLGGLIEIVQEQFVEYRGGEWLDLLADVSGSAIATVVSFLVVFPLMKKFLASFLTFAAVSAAFPAGVSDAAPRVRTGIEVLRDMDFAPLAGKRVGLVTNPSGVDCNLRSTIEILNDAPQVNLVALYAPEHGLRGDVYAGGHVSDYVDPSTGLPVYSLFGPTRKPTAKMLEGIDVMVYDIQDVGARCYTFISTLGLVMGVCATLDIEVLVLDRPNPVGGLKIEGCYVEQPFNSFVSQYRIPLVYGLTPGELAMLINGEGLNRGQKGDETPQKCKLEVIKMEGWTRDMTYEDTGLPWVLPSPNIPYASTAQYYLSSGLCGEIYNYLQVGLSYTLPFQVFAATWINPSDLMAELDSYALPGVSFRPVYYRPFAGSQAGKLVAGVQTFFTDYGKVRLTEIQFYVIQALARLYPEHLPFGPDEKVGLFDKVCGTDYIRKTFGRSYRVDDILDYWRKDEEEFRELSSRYYLY